MTNDERNFPFVSVVIPTRDRAHLLRDCLKGLRIQSYPIDLYEIVIVDDGSQDNTPQVAAQWANSGAPDIRYVRIDRKGLNAARNAGIRAARGDPICFVDDDDDVPPTWLEAMIKGVLRHPDAGCFGGPIQLRLEARPPRMCGHERLGETELDLGNEECSADAVYGANFSVRRSALHAVGLFDEALPIYGDEEEWERRYKARAGVIWYVPQAWLWHRRLAEDLRFLPMLRRRFRRRRNQTQYLRLTGQNVPICSELVAFLRNVGHAVKRGCPMGVIAAAENVGRIWGALKV